MKEDTGFIARLLIPAVGLSCASAGCSTTSARRASQFSCDLTPAADTGMADISVERANALLDPGGGHVYLDVRTIPEFIEGHPAGALNIPVFVRDADSGTMTLNADFLRVIKAKIATDQPVIVGCRSGRRSAKATKFMMDAGYEHVHNMLGGFYGARDTTGTIITPGWLELGYEIEKGDVAGRAPSDDP